MPGSESFAFDERLTRNAVRVGSIGLLCAIAAIVLGVALESLLPADSEAQSIFVLHVIAAASRGFGMGFSLYFGMLLVAGLLGAVAREWRTRRLVAVTLLVVAVGAFLFVPICWSATSDDCRSLAIRARDVVFHR